MLRVSKMLILHSSCWVQSFPSVHGRSTYWVPLGGPILISTRGGPILISTRGGPIFISTRPPLPTGRSSSAPVLPPDGPISISTRGREVLISTRDGPILISTRGGPIFISTGPPTDGPIPISTRGGPILIILPYPSRAGSGPGATGCLWPSGYSI